jgi:hypothetical protein
MTWMDRLFHRRRIYDDFAAEIEAHLGEKVDDLVRQGMSRSDALLAARRAFGNVTRVQEDGREPWQWPTLESVLTDIRFALRQLRRTPAFTAIVMLTLAIGIASTATVFSWTRAILLDPLPGAAGGRCERGSDDQGPAHGLGPDLAVAQDAAQPTNDAPNNYNTIKDYFKLPEGRTWGSTSAVDIDKDGTSIWVAERCGQNSCLDRATGKMSDVPTVLKFDSTGKLVKSFGAGPQTGDTL